MDDYVGFIAWTACSVSFVLLGVSCFFKKEAVRFWNIKQEIKVDDPVGYNRAVGWLWVVSGAVLVLLGIPFLAGQNSPWIVLSILGGIALCLVLMVFYNLIEKKYRIY